MTNKEAAEILRRMKSDFPLPKAAQTRRAQNDALNVAIEVLKAESCDDAISRQAAIDVLKRISFSYYFECGEYLSEDTREIEIINSNKALEAIKALPPAQPTLCGYDIEHLILIANVMRKENLPPERVVEALTDIGRIVSIVKDEFEESLRKAVEQCKI